MRRLRQDSGGGAYQNSDHLGHFPVSLKLLQNFFLKQPKLQPSCAGLLGLSRVTTGKPPPALILEEMWGHVKGKGRAAGRSPRVLLKRGRDCPHSRLPSNTTLRLRADLGTAVGHLVVPQAWSSSAPDRVVGREATCPVCGRGERSLAQRQKQPCLYRDVPGVERSLFLPRRWVRSCASRSRRQDTSDGVRSPARVKGRGCDGEKHVQLPDLPRAPSASMWPPDSGHERDLPAGPHCREPPPQSPRALLPGRHVRPGLCPPCPGSRLRHWPDNPQIDTLKSLSPPRG